MIYVDLQYLEPYGVDIRPLERDLYVRHRHLWDEMNIKMTRALLNAPDVKAVHKKYGPAVEIGLPDEIQESERRAIEKGLKDFIPWKKGPYKIYGVDIDGEWRSDIKWQRVLPYLDSLEGKTICDIGSNNGYFMFRMLEQNPKLVLGMDPTRRMKLTFEYIQKFAREDALKTELLGFEHLPYFQSVFDVIFCMGILYHHSDPVSILANCLSALRPGGQLILETMGIEGDEPVCIFPRRRYADMKNVWFVPTHTVIYSWLERAGFDGIKLVFNEQLTSAEQRVTVWSPGKSLEDFLDKSNKNLTMEGYTRPSRIYFTARKKKKRYKK